MLHRLSGGLTALALFGMSFGCATGVNVAGTGGDSSSSSTGGMDAGMNQGPCTMASDCIAMTDTCNVGTCVNGTCVKAPANELSPCDDGQFCTENDACKNGVCVGGTAKYCPTSNTCHVGTC